jgi:hypothetical protein
LHPAWGDGNKMLIAFDQLFAGYSIYGGLVQWKGCFVNQISKIIILRNYHVILSRIFMHSALNLNTPIEVYIKVNLRGTQLAVRLASFVKTGWYFFAFSFKSYKFIC